MALTEQLLSQTDRDTDEYYQALLSRVDETLEETKREKEPRRRGGDGEIELRTLNNGSQGEHEYVVELYINGATPKQVLTFVSAAVWLPGMISAFNPREFVHVGEFRRPLVYSPQPCDRLTVLWTFWSPWCVRC
jgi:hypothetical protein